MSLPPFLLLAALLFAAGMNRAEAAALTLAIAGTEGVRFSGDCLLATDTGSRPLRLEGAVPRTYALAGSGVRCRIRKEGHSGSLTVEVRRAGTVVSQATVAGGTASMTIAVE